MYFEMAVKKRLSKEQFVVCIRNEDCEDLEFRKIYQVLSDKKAAATGYIRVLDESGEDYLYPESYFLPIALPQKLEEALLPVA